MRPHGGRHGDRPVIRSQSGFHAAATSAPWEPHSGRHADRHGGYHAVAMVIPGRNVLGKLRKCALTAVTMRPLW